MGRIIEVLRSFVSDETGFVKQQNSLELSWVVGVLMWAAAITGMPQAADAGTGYHSFGPPPCYYFGSNYCGTKCYESGHQYGGAYCETDSDHHDVGKCYCKKYPTDL